MFEAPWRVSRGIREATLPGAGGGRKRRLPASVFQFRRSAGGKQLQESGLAGSGDEAAILEISGCILFPGEFGSRESGSGPQEDWNPATICHPG